MTLPSTRLLTHSPDLSAKSSLKRLIILPLILLLAVLLAPAVWSQSDLPTAGMSVEELETYIAKQQEALESAKLEREKQLEKRRQIQAALDDKKKHLSEIQNEMNVLCAEREELDPANNEPCAGEGS